MPTFSDILKQHYEQSPDKTIVALLHGGQPDCPVMYRELIHGAAGYAKTLKKSQTKRADHYNIGAGDSPSRTGHSKNC